MTDNHENTTACHKLAAKLVTVPDFPRQNEVLDLVADDLLELCADVTEASWIVAEARKWPKWRGTAGIIDLLRERRPPTVLPPERQVFDPGQKPPIGCGICQDFGYLFRGGHYEYCSCETGVEARKLKLCEGLNEWRMKNMRAPHATPAAARPRPLTQEDLDKAYSERQDRTADGIAKARATLASADVSKVQR